MLEEDVELDECIVMDYVRIKRGARLRRTIVGLYNTIEAGTKIGYDSDLDTQRFNMSPSGIVVVADGHPNKAGVVK